MARRQGPSSVAESTLISSMTVNPELENSVEWPEVNLPSKNIQEEEEHMEEESHSEGSNSEDSDDSLANLDAFAAAAALLSSHSKTTSLDTDTPFSSRRNSSNSEDGGRRRSHNVCERKRRQQIRDAFAALQKRLPDKSEKMSKMDILKAAIEHIRSLKDNLDDIERQVQAYRATRSLA